jgi:hypothetical protein
MKLENLTFDQIYLIYVNDFLTIQGMADYYNVPANLLTHWLECGKHINNNTTAEDWEEFQNQVNDLYFNLI